MLDWILVVFLFAFVIGFVVAQLRALLKWTGGWRIVAIIPTAVLIVVIIRIVRDFEAHNLWPIELVMWMFFGLILLGVCYFLGAERKRGSEEND